MSDLINPLSPGSLDLDEIRTNIKQYLIDNDIIKDVNYVGSNISIFVDIMAYSIYNVNATTATGINQMLLPLSTIRENIVRLAQNNGYYITRRISSKLSVTLSYALTAGKSITIPAYTEWTCGDFTFVNTSDILLTEGSPSATVDLVEGTVIDSSIDSSLEYDITEATTAWVLNYKYIENDSVRVYVKRSTDTSYSASWTKTDSLLTLTSDNEYFHETYNADTGWVDIDIAFASQGNTLVSGDSIKFLFLISSGASANGVASCLQKETIVDSDSAEVALTISVNSVSRGGQNEESEASIKENAPVYYNTGGRVVNEYDYASFLIKSSIVETAVAWGGESHIPEKLGHIFFSAIPQDPSRKYISTTNEASLLSLLSTVRIVSTYRHFWQPQYYVVDLDVKILGNPNSVTTKQNSISTITTDFFDTYANKFNTSFFVTKLVSKIESVFDTEPEASAIVIPKPMLKLAEENFVNNTNDDGDLVVYIPNSPKRWYLEKAGERIEIPTNETDLNTYIINGWVRTYDSVETLDVVFGGTVNGVAVSTVDNLDGTKSLFHNSIEIGVFDIAESYLVIDADFVDEVVADASGYGYITLDYTATIDSVDYAAHFNVKALKNAYIELGDVTYV